MERGYLIAALAMIATFTAMSHGARSLAHVWRASTRHYVWIVKPECDRGATASQGENMQTRLRPNYAEEAELLAQLDLPVAEMQSQVAAQMARHNAEIARCAGARAMQEAMRARQQAMRLQQEAIRQTMKASQIGPL